MSWSSLRDRADASGNKLTSCRVFHHKRLNSLNSRSKQARYADMSIVLLPFERHRDFRFLFHPRDGETREILHFSKKAHFPFIREVSLRIKYLKADPRRIRKISCCYLKFRSQSVSPSYNHTQTPSYSRVGMYQNNIKRG